MPDTPNEALSSPTRKSGSTASSRLRPSTPMRGVLGSLLALCGVALIVAAFAGFTDPLLGGILCGVFMIGCGAVVGLLGKPSSPTVRRILRYLRPVVVVLAAPLGFLMVELPYNVDVLALGPEYIMPNLALYGVLLAAVYFAGQRTRGSVLVFLFLCLLAGVGNGFVSEFKGQPVLPADLFALSTAAEVAGGYVYVLRPGMLGGIALWSLWAAVLSVVPKVCLSTGRVVANSVIALVVAGAFSWWYATTDIGESLQVKVDVWSVRESYSKQGALLGFMKRTQDLTPSRPDGYSEERVTEILAAYPDETADFDAAAQETVTPTVIAVMNETFADLSWYPGLEDSGLRPDGFYEVAEGALEYGTALVSAMGGGTCNSEFEFLTGASMAHLGAGVYPYVLYDLAGTESLASYFKSLGYETHALHPNEASNWRRSAVYDQLAFDDFASISSFEDADTLRNLVTDAATYDYILNLLEQSEAPQFIFDVTMQNHGGYETGLVPEELRASADLPDGSSDDEVNEYLSVLRQSEADLLAFVGRLDELERPVVLCFFGDHQPGFNNRLFQMTHDGKTADEIGLAAVQERYEVPYLIWANRAAREAGIGTALEEAGAATAVSAQDAIEGSADTSHIESDAAGIATLHDGRVTSLNYLGARLALATGLPLTSRQQFLLDEERLVPATNMNGFMAADGTWHYHSEDTERDIRDEAAIVQYDNLFG